MAKEKAKSKAKAKAKPAGKAKSKAAAPIAGIPEAHARQLLKLLSTDDGFRRRFKKNPTAGLLEAAGVSPQAAACCKVKKLAGKKAIAAAHDEILDTLTKCLAQTPVQLSLSK